MREGEIRTALRVALAEEFADDTETLIVDELGLDEGNVRIDLAVVNGALHGYEIKSERDTLARLPVQAAGYGRVFDHVTLVTSTRHLGEIDAIVPWWWTIMTPAASGERIVFDTHRPGAANPEVDARFVARLLWRDEVLEILERRGLATGLRSKPRRVLWDALADAVSLEDLAVEVRFAL